MNWIDWLVISYGAIILFHLIFERYKLHRRFSVNRYGITFWYKLYSGGGVGKQIITFFWRKRL